MSNEISSCALSSYNTDANCISAINIQTSALNNMNQTIDNIIDVVTDLSDNINYREELFIDGGAVSIYNGTFFGSSTASYQSNGITYSGVSRPIISGQEPTQWEYFYSFPLSDGSIVVDTQLSDISFVKKLLVGDSTKGSALSVNKNLFLINDNIIDFSLSSHEEIWMRPDGIQHSKHLSGSLSDDYSYSRLYRYPISSGIIATQEYVDSKISSGSVISTHNHDDRYYVKIEIENQLSTIQSYFDSRISGVYQDIAQISSYAYILEQKMKNMPKLSVVSEAFDPSYGLSDVFYFMQVSGDFTKIYIGNKLIWKND